MTALDLVIQGGTVVTAADSYRADVGVRGGRIVAIGDTLSGTETIDASGLLVLPGGIDAQFNVLSTTTVTRLSAPGVTTSVTSASNGV